jgi:hypothetical protein
MREKIHEMENVLEDGELQFMYDRAYGDIKFETIHGLTPYNKLLNQLFRYILCSKGGDSDNISNMSKNLIVRMAPNQNEFSVFYFIWEEIIILLSFTQEELSLCTIYLCYDQRSDRCG